MVSPECLPDTLEDLQTLEHRIEREWWWINGALHAVAQLQSDGPEGLRELRAQARNVERLRVAISVRLAELTRTDATRSMPTNAPRQSL